MGAALAADWTRIEIGLKQVADPALQAGRLDGAVVMMVADGQVHQVTLGTVAQPLAFEVGSISKAFTGELLAEAVRRGEVELDDSLAKHVSGLPKWAKKMTLVQLATHTSGLPRLPAGFEGPPDDPYAPWTRERFLAALAETEPSEPGTYVYSNLGPSVLGLALEQASGKDYGTLLAERIAGPLSLAATGIDNGPVSQGHDASGRPVPPWTSAAFAPTTGVHATPSDLVQWMRAHFAPTGDLGASFDLAMRSIHRDAATDVGLLWHRTAQGVVWHNGQTGGHHSLVAFVPGARAGVVALGATATDLVDQLGFAALQLTQGLDPEPIEIRPAMRLAPAELEELVGRYGPITIEVREGAPWLVLDGQPAYRLWATSPRSLYLLEAPVEVELAGNTLVFRQQGMPEQRFERAQAAEPATDQESER